MDQHTTTVNQISSRLKSLYKTKTPFRIFHGSTNSTRNYTVNPATMIDTSPLTHILSISSTTKTAILEPNVSMEALVSATLPFNLMPAVVMEFRGITAGGGFAGTGAESSSFASGSFDRCVRTIEIVLPDGEIVNCPRDSELFSAATGSLGTFGVLTLLEIELIPAAAFVEATYTPFDSVSKLLSALEVATQQEKGIDYIDAVLTSPTRGILITGHLTSSPSTPTLKLQSFTQATDPWFYIHVDRATANNTTHKEIIPLQSYLFRYDRGAFWMGAYAFNYFLMPFNRMTRWLLDPFMQTGTMYHALHASGHSQNYMIQDVALPAGNACAFIDDVGRTFGIFPLWLCPMRKCEAGPASFHPHALASTEKVVNVGVWGPNNASSASDAVNKNRRLEALVKKHGGRKWLYAQAFYTRDEFWSVYDKGRYDELRGKYRAEHLPSVFDKACINRDDVKNDKEKGWSEWIKDKAWNVWPVSGVYGVLQTVISSDYLLGRK